MRLAYDELQILPEANHLIFLEQQFLMTCRKSLDVKLTEEGSTADCQEMSRFSCLTIEETAVCSCCGKALKVVGEIGNAGWRKKMCIHLDMSLFGG